MVQKFRPISHLLHRGMIVLSLTIGASAQSFYPDQAYTLEGSDSLFANAAEINHLIASADGRRIELESGQTQGYIVFEAQTSQAPFNRGLPSWNGTAPDSATGFKVFLRFPSGSGWSPWLTAGYWQNNLWPSYGQTSFSGGYIDIDYIKLYSYLTSWQYRVEFSRSSLDQPSPSLSKLNIFLSDTRKTDETNISDLVNDNPPKIFIPTTFYYQYALDQEIGGRICSPTSTSMALRSYDIDVNPVAFAWDTYDPYFDIFGVWPRAVQNASGFGFVGSVTRFRSWGDAYAVLAAGGRIVITVGEPLYSGHLMMLAGFDSTGTPIVHDPARSDGYAYKHDKTALSQSWFNKGGIAYVFYPADTASVGVNPGQSGIGYSGPKDYEICSNYPNPFNSSTRIMVFTDATGPIRTNIMDIAGRFIRTLISEPASAGPATFLWDGTNHYGQRQSSGLYWSFVEVPDGRVLAHKMLLLK